MKNKTWILVANSTQARIYHAEKVGTLTEVHVLDHPEGHLHNQDLVADKPGRTNPSTFRAQRSMEPHHSPKSQENSTFAKEVSRYLDQSREQGLFTRLYIAAAPTFLGMLRQVLSQGTAAVVAGEVSKDLIHLKPKEICDVVPFVL